MPEILVKRFKTAEAVRDFLKEAAPGCVFEYARGPFLDLPKGVQPELIRAAMPNKAGVPPKLALFQKREGPFRFSYRAMVMDPQLAAKAFDHSERLCRESATVTSEEARREAAQVVQLRRCASGATNAARRSVPARVVPLAAE